MSMCLQFHGHKHMPLMPLNVAFLLGTGLSMMQPSTWDVVGKAIKTCRSRRNAARQKAKKQILRLHPITRRSAR